MSAPGTPPILRQSLSWLALAVVFAAPLLPALHLATTSHHLCDAHGVEDGDGDHDGHHQCDAFGVLGDARTAPAIAVAAAPETYAAVPTVPALAHAPGGPSRLAVAPKTSPPARA